MENIKMYIKIINNEPVYYSIRELRIDNFQVSFPETITNELLQEFDVYPLYDGVKSAFDKLTHRLINTTPVYEDNKWIQPWITIELSYDEIIEQSDAEAKEVRLKRNKLLTDCDWTQVLDAPVDQAAWATYRQALRDITTQEGFPWLVEWPQKGER